MREHDFMAMDAAGGAGGAAPAEPATAAAPAAASPAAPSPAPADSAPGPGAAPTGGLLARGAAPAPAGASPAAAPAATADPAEAKVPEKFLVKNADGSINHEQTALKIATEGYAPLEKRLHAGDAPPKTPDEYAPTVPAGVKLEDLKADPLYTGFLKGAHARGMTNAHVSYVLEAMAQREATRNSPEVAEIELRKEWKTDDQLQAGLTKAYRAAAAYAGGDETLQRLQGKFGSDPDFIRLMAKVGGEMGEDTPPQGLNANESDTLQSLMAHPAYFDAKHPEHAIIVRRTQALYLKKTGGK